MALDRQHKKIVLRGIFSSLPMLLGLSVLFIIAEGKGVFLIPCKTLCYWFYVYSSIDVMICCTSRIYRLIYKKIPHNTIVRDSYLRIETIKLLYF
ncbi:hypothetical protein BK054_05665 [Myroides sp. ZB35]|uniref:Uncharacterized protein n=1 Tax=Myroides odoratimimus TaxID=76832 RepID=A0AAI8C3W0_9FLAO|nr:hypothetical protein AS202_05785 [Myroides odoratimimus]APA91710.1 hypothetical protein BK054_05665 [Myroides sp. ZB35]